MNADSGKVTLIGEAPGRGHMAVSNSGVFGKDEGTRLWHFDPASGKIRRSAVDLPNGDWSGPLRWARGADADQLITADSSGQIFSFNANKGFRSLGKAHLAPVGPMAMTPDGRLFGFCGEEMANLFCCDTMSGRVSNLGVAASIFEKRRYGYQFAAAIVGRDGEIIFGEDDNDGHLWLYFPRIHPVPRTTA
jgi:hypothetical protein